MDIIRHGVKQRRLLQSTQHLCGHTHHLQLVDVRKRDALTGPPVVVHIANSGYAQTTYILAATHVLSLEVPQIHARWGSTITIVIPLLKGNVESA